MLSAAGLGLWVGSLDCLAAHHTVYALDLPGFGRSVRLPFAEATTPEQGEDYFVGLLEQWRRAMGLTGFALLGHSMGGFVSAVYAMRFPQHVRHLLLVDPWGVGPKPPEWESEVDWHYRIFANVVTSFNPLATIRAAGPWGPDILVSVRGDLVEKFEPLYSGRNPRVVLDYIYHINAQDPTGEDAFAAMTDTFQWAKQPLQARLPAGLPEHVPVSVICGEESWLDVACSRALAEALGCPFHVIEKGGHHCYIDGLDDFNRWVLHQLEHPETRRPAPAAIESAVGSGG